MVNVGATADCTPVCFRPAAATSVDVQPMPQPSMPGVWEFGHRSPVPASATQRGTVIDVANQSRATRRLTSGRALVLMVTGGSEAVHCTPQDSNQNNVVFFATSNQAVKSFKRLMVAVMFCSCVNVLKSCRHPCFPVSAMLSVRVCVDHVNNDFIVVTTFCCLIAVLCRLCYNLKAHSIAFFGLQHSGS
jgi:hypothetical protein